MRKKKSLDRKLRRKFIEKKLINKVMEYQQLPPVSMIIGAPNSNHSSQVHNLNHNNNGTNSQIIPMQPPLLPLQVAHNLHQLTTSSHNNNQLNNNVHHVNGGSQNPNSQPLPPTAQLLQAIHNTHHQTNLQSIGNNNTNGTTNSTNDANNNDENSRWTQYQVQQLWRHHAYLNGK